MIFPFLQVITCGKMDVVVKGPAISMVVLAAICLWLKAEANLFPAAGSRALLKRLPNDTDYEPFTSD
jgi:hypothetical protein